VNHFLLEIDQYIASISAIVWLFPPIRQFRTKYFYFFLFLAIMGTVSRVIRQVFESPTNVHLIISAFCLFLSMFSLVQLKKKVWFIIPAISVMLYLSYLKPIILIDLVILFIIIFAISIIILKRIIEYTINEKAMNIFQIILLFYFTTNITKFLNMIFQFTDAPAYFTLTNLIQIIIAVFFCVYTEDNPKMKIPLKSLQKLEI